MISPGPFTPKFSFRTLKESYELLLKSKNPSERFQAGQVLKLFTENPLLVEGTFDLSEFEKYGDSIQELMGYLFPAPLTMNEIKAAVYPLSNLIFYKSKRLETILDRSAHTIETLFKEQFIGHIEEFELIPYAIILNNYYQFNVDLDRTKNLKIESQDGTIKNYRVTFNADFLRIYPNESAIEITREIIDELLADATNKEIWKRYFPEGSWTMEGFGIINMIDTTLDENIEGFKTHLIQTQKGERHKLLEAIRDIFGIPDMKMGIYVVDKDSVRSLYGQNTRMLTLEEKNRVDCKDFACNNVYKKLFIDREAVVISNIESYHKRSKGNNLSKTLLQQDLKSTVLMPVSIDGNLAFILELATHKPNQLNAINMAKMETLMPFIISYSERSFNEYKNEISAVIQQECTSIHPSVAWRFEEEASLYIEKRNAGELPNFNEIVFNDVVPLYGQIDIVGSSQARNVAIKKDLTQQMNRAKNILDKRFHLKKQPFYEHLIYQIDSYLLELEINFHTNTEQEINGLFAKEILPLFEHMLASEKNALDIEDFFAILNHDTGTYYDARKEYDNTINLINKKLSGFIDKQQLKAQEMFPHYFEKFKTDGVEHNMYIGQSITGHRAFHMTDLYNLRLWQLQIACEMEAMYYEAQENFPLKLDVASLILAYDIPLQIRYRIDEKQFDVDGAYNVRYELIKKRIDKAYIKDTTERLTQPGKLCVVYSSNAIEKEYLRYVGFLQSKNYIGQNVEIVEVEELQGASGIKAIRVDLNLNFEKVGNMFTVKDLEIAN